VLEEKLPESQSFRYQREMTRKIDAIKQLASPADADFGALGLSGGHHLATPLGNDLFMPSTSPD
jgi:hypothetical protein